MREFLGGAGLLARGFGWWTRRPGLMALGLVPAAIVALLFLGGLIVLGAYLPGIVTAVTPFAEGWPGVWATVIRITIGTAMVGAALVIVAVSFTALTLLLGEPFYDRIWRAVERDAGGDAVDGAEGFWRAVGDTFSLLARGALVAIFAAVLGLIPVVGGVIAAVVGVGLTGWLIADELSARALSARGIDRAARRRLLARHRARALGFGVATQLCFLVPFGAIATMPAAVAGSTLLAQSFLAPTARS
ncbi:EI24 domain-containing protein [Microbacterium aoyamense]|uniref:EI24 domain-containing protein n=2 Tax=Microbacterium aoyamense TaxID=344166 RepID=A0ABP5B2N8_9MICO